MIVADEDAPGGRNAGEKVLQRSTGSKRALAFETYATLSESVANVVRAPVPEFASNL